MHYTAHLPKDPTRKTSRERVLLLCAAISLIAFVVEQTLVSDNASSGFEAKEKAVQIMRSALDALREHREKSGAVFDLTVDPNRTALIGEEYTEITTTPGSLEAKRTTTNPAMAGLIVQLLEEAGVVAGDTIAVGCSGSFPALAVATLAASKALGVTPVVVASIGSSSYGATDSDMTLPDVLDLLTRKGIIEHQPDAVSLGGADDVGNEFEPEVRQRLIAGIAKSGIPLILEPELQRNVAQRLAVYFGPEGLRKVAAFVNIGGNYVDLGTSPLILKLEPGVNRKIELPDNSQTHGVVFAMSKRHIPVVHLLYIKGLVLKYGLPWDPVPFPDAGGRKHSQAHASLISPAGLTMLAYLVIISLMLLFYRNVFFRTHS
jgi:poly-gamma-glutamate system protein